MNLKTRCNKKGSGLSMPGTGTKKGVRSWNKERGQVLNCEYPFATLRA